MKRIIPAVLAAGALAFAACGSSSSTKSTPTTAAPAGSTPATSGSSSASSAPASSGGGATTLQESGSSLLYPFLQAVAPGFHTANPSITLAPQPGGSGKGVSDAAAGTTDFGGSDAYLSSVQMAQYTSLANIPIVVSSQAVNYNLKGIKNLKLTGAVLAQMYLGTITKWNDPAVAKLNPGVTLPAEAVHPVHRSDSSGDSFLFTSLMTKTSPTWATKIGPNELPTWPSAGGASAAASGNPGMVQTCSQTPGCVAYIGISAEKTAVSAGLGEAALQNASGNYVQPSPTTVEAAVKALTTIPSNLAVSLIYTQGAQAYPIVNFEYIMVKKGASKAAAIKTFLDYVIDPAAGSSATNLAVVNFEPLPAAVVTKVKAAIASI